VSALRAELRDLYDDYASCLDEMDLAAWSGFFTDDCTYKVIPFENYSQDLPLALIECRGIGVDPGGNPGRLGRPGARSGTHTGTTSEVRMR
jgi:hypothetical protein